MKVLIVGGTGFVGRELIEVLLKNGHQAVVLTRNKEQALKMFNSDVTAVEWNSNFQISPLAELEKVDAVINLAGESIGSGRWTSSKKAKIVNSRIESTRAIVEAIHAGVLKPNVLINASAVGFYGPHTDESLTELDPAGEDFLAQLSKAWEHEANKAELSGVRVVKVRIGLVLGAGGALKQMLLPYKLFVGGSIGSGQQWVSWIHINDLVEIFRYALESDLVNGPINATSPNPVKMQDFAKEIGGVLKKPTWLTIPAVFLRLVLGEMSAMLLTGQRVLPKKLTEYGFEHRYPKLEKALENILS